MPNVNVTWKFYVINPARLVVGKVDLREYDRRVYSLLVPKIIGLLLMIDKSPEKSVHIRAWNQRTWKRLAISPSLPYYTCPDCSRNTVPPSKSSYVMCDFYCIKLGFAGREGVVFNVYYAGTCGHACARALMASFLHYPARCGRRKPRGAAPPPPPSQAPSYWLLCAHATN